MRKIAVMRTRKITAPMFPVRPALEPAGERTGIAPADTLPDAPMPDRVIEPDNVIEIEALRPVPDRSIAEEPSFQETPLHALATEQLELRESLNIEEARRCMQEAADLDDLLLGLALGVHRHLDHVQVYLNEPGRSRMTGALEVVNGEVDRERVRERAIPLDVPSLLSRMVTNGLIYVGPAPDIGPSAEILASTGVLGATDVALASVIHDNETFCLVVGHCGKRPLAEEIVPMLSTLALEAAVALAHHSTELAPVPSSSEPNAARVDDDEGISRAPLEAQETEPGLGENLPAVVDLPTTALRALIGQLTDDSNSQIQQSAARALRAELGTEPLESLLSEIRRGLTDPDPQIRNQATRTLGVLRDPCVVSPLVVLLADPDTSVAEAAHVALVEITGQDFGFKESRWERWWNANRHLTRQQWLVDALSHDALARRIAAARELEELTGMSLERFDPTASRKAREAARQSFQEQLSFERWWLDNEM